MEVKPWVITMTRIESSKNTTSSFSMRRHGESAFDDCTIQRPQDLTDKQTIDSAGGAIAETSASIPYLDLFWDRDCQKLNRNKWDEFRNSIKTQALNWNWGARMIQKLCRSEQCAIHAVDYVDKLENIRFPIERSSHLQPISDFEFNCHLFFHTNLTLTAQVTSKERFDFLDGSVNNVTEKTRGFDLKSPCCSDTPTPLADHSGLPRRPTQMPSAQRWIDSDTRGNESFPFVKFSDFDQFIDVSSGNLPGHMTNITIPGPDNGNRSLLVGYKSQFSNPGSYMGRELEHSHINTVLALNDCDYLTSVQVSRKKSTCSGVAALKITTANGYSVVFGRESSDYMTILSSTSEWRVVGFEGSWEFTGTDNLFFLRLGVFFLVYFFVTHMYAKFMARLNRRFGYVLLLLAGSAAYILLHQYVFNYIWMFCHAGGWFG